MPIESAADLLIATVDGLSARAPAVVAAAAAQLQDILLGLHFGDGSHAQLRAIHSRLQAEPGRAASAPAAPQVEVYFDDRSLSLLFDLERRPGDQLAAGSLDVRGPREQVLAVWRTFQILSQRASGLRWTQALWKEYRNRQPERWGRLPAPAAAAAEPAAFPPPRATAWRALEYLDQRAPEDATSGDDFGSTTVVDRQRWLWDGRHSEPWWLPAAQTDADLFDLMAACKRRVREELLRIIPEREPRAQLYDLVRDYPLREGKGLRPTLTIAACAALGGRPEDAVRAAAAIELFHNGFLVHDDVSDESLHRRNLQTMHEAHGTGLAVNTGDAMLLLAVDTVLSNIPTIGLARTLGLIHEVLHMCRETVEGQAIELGWIRAGEVPERDEDYFRMSTKKTGWYTCISPCRLGAICAGVTDPALLDRFNEVLRLIGIAFQIQDDVLNLIGEEALYGKEPLGDLLEGKRTVMLIHLFRGCAVEERRWLHELLLRPRVRKSQEDAERILAAMRRAGSIEYAIALADGLASQGVLRFEQDLDFLPESEAKATLRQIAHYVTTRKL